VANQKSFNQLKRNKAGVCDFANTRFSFGPEHVRLLLHLSEALPIFLGFTLGDLLSALIARYREK
jgi:hypothetical protein